MDAPRSQPMAEAMRQRHAETASTAGPRRCGLRVMNSSFPRARCYQILHDVFPSITNISRNAHAALKTPQLEPPILVRMTTLRLFAISLILFVAALAWFILGTSVTARSGQFDSMLATEVSQLWGGPHRQLAPVVLVEREKLVREKLERRTESGKTITSDVTRTVIDRQAVQLAPSHLDVDLRLQYRQKGLLWYDTYTVRFNGRYTVQNPDSIARPLVARLSFPSKDALYDEFVLRFNGADAPPVSDLSNGVEVRSVIPPGGTASLEVGYVSRGLDKWVYALAKSGVSRVQNLTVAVTTDFDAVDFPAGTMSPTSRVRAGSGSRIDWNFSSLVTGQAIGIDLPDKTNPGPLAARITYFAPVSLLFFMTV